MDPAELFSKAPTEKKEANAKLNMVKFLQVNFWIGLSNRLHYYIAEDLKEINVLMVCVFLL